MCFNINYYPLTLTFISIISYNVIIAINANLVPWSSRANMS